MMQAATPLFSVESLLLQMPPIEKWCPLGHFSYASWKFTQAALQDSAILQVAERMAEGLADPRFAYRCKYLEAGMIFGHGRWHLDGRGEAGEIHRLLTVGGTPTEGQEGQILDAGTVWEYSGEYSHRARPAKSNGVRLLLRVSQTAMLYRDHWVPL